VRALLFRAGNTRMEQFSKVAKKIGELLIEQKLISSEQLQEALYL
jgi:hypothetical protein